MVRFWVGLLALVACGRTLSSPTGGEGGPCYGNGSCDAGFVCAEEVCVGEAVLACEAVTCSDHGTCSLRDGMPVCVCDAGFRALGLACIDPTGCVDTPHTFAFCDGGDVYWFDGCGEREELRFDCGGAGCAGSHCAGAVVGMVYIADYPAGPFWIDTFEASLTGPGDDGEPDQDADDDGKIADAEAAAAHATSHGLVFDDDGGEELTQITTRAANSALGVYPVNFSFYQAAGACTRAGKRLCTDGEWRWVCQGGTALNEYPYGDTFDDGDEPGVDCWTNWLAPVQPTGIASGCVTPTGVFDLSGNVAEWAGYHGTGSGRVWGGDVGETASSVTCGAESSLHPHSTASWVGFRCCRDP